MNQIYTNADRVVVWLGLDTPEIEAAQKTIDDLSAKADQMQFEWHPNGELWAGPHPRGDITASDAVDIVIRVKEAPLTAILGQPWFERLWIIQELFLAKTAVLVCGHRAIEWTKLAIVLAFICKALDQINILETVAKEINVVKLKHAYLMARQRLWFRYWDNPSCMILGPWSGSFIFGMYEKFRDQKCFDDRDRVWGYSGLHGHEEGDHRFENGARSVYERKLGLDVDYKLTVQQTYKALALSVYKVKGGGPRTLLPHSGIWHRDLQASSSDITSPSYLPSWVPDLRPYANTSRLPRKMQDLHFHTAGNLEAMYDYSRVDENILSVRGTIYDNFACLVKCDEEFAATTTLSKNLLGHHVALELDEYPTGEDVVLAFLRTMGLGDDQVSEERLIEIWKSYRKVIFRKDDEPPPDEETYREWMVLHNIIVSTVSGDCAVVTKKGHFGIVPYATELDDKVAIIAGETVPFVVRWKKEYEAYIIVGACYIQGLMQEGESNPVDEELCRYWVPLA